MDEINFINEDIVIVNSERVMIGFINSRLELEYTEYKAHDGGCIELDDIKKYTKEELAKILTEFCIPQKCWQL